MSIQDPNVNVEFINYSKKKISGQLRVQHANENISFSFFPETEKNQRRNPTQLPEMYFNLSEFSSFERDPEKEEYISFLSSNPQINCTFYFKEKKDISKFMDYLGQKAHVICSKENPYIFILQPIEYGKGDFQSTILPPVTDFNPSKRVSLERLENLFKEKIDISNKLNDLIINPQIYNPEIKNNSFDLVNQVLSSDIPTGGVPYSSIKNQWKLIIIPDQFDQYPNLDSLIRSIEDDIINRSDKLGINTLSNPNKFQKITFNILLTYSFYNWDGAYYFNGQVELLYPFLRAHILQYGEDCDSDKCEEDVFNIFVDFYEKGEFNALKLFGHQKYIKPMLIDAGKKINEKFHEILELLAQKNVKTLDFLIDDCSKWFIDISQSTEETLKLWISILDIKDKVLCFKALVISLLILTAPEISETNPINYDEFAEMFDKIKKKVNISDLLERAIQIMALINE